MILQNLCILALSAFISVNGKLVEVPQDADVYQEYQTESITDIGDPINVLSEIVEGTAEPFVEPTSEPVVEPSVSPSAEPTSEPVVVVQNNEEEIALLSDMVELLAENSDSATGTLNSSILSLMDRMVDTYPSYYKYAGFRTDSDDSYASTLYISKSSSVNGNTITFGDDCVAVTFNRQSDLGYSGYVYYSVSDSPGASVDVNSRTIVYTNCLKGYPALGTKSFFQEHYIWILVFVILAAVLFLRRSKD